MLIKAEDGLSPFSQEIYCLIVGYTTQPRGECGTLGFVVPYASEDLDKHIYFWENPAARIRDENMIDSIVCGKLSRVERM